MTLFNRLRLRSTEPVTYAYVAKYSGIRSGWQQIGEPKLATDAERFAKLLARIHPNFLYRVVLA